MSPDERRRALLALVAAQLEDRRAESAIKKSYVAYGRVSFPCVAKVMKGSGDYKIGTLIDIADTLNCDVEIVIHKRSA